MTNRDLGKCLRSKFPQYSFRIKYNKVEAWIPHVCKEDGCRTHYRIHLSEAQLHEIEEEINRLRQAT